MTTFDIPPPVVMVLHCYPILPRSASCRVNVMVHPSSES